MKLYRGKGQKILIIVAVMLVVIGFSIGFSAFSVSLTIKSKADIKPDSSTFSVLFSSSSTSLSTNDVVPILTPDTISAFNAKINNNTNPPTISNFSVQFQEPGDKAQYVFYARNTGGLDAYLQSITFYNVTGKSSNKICTPLEGTLASDITSVCSNIKLTLQVGSYTTTTSKSGITNHVLPKNSSEQVIITVEFVDDGSVYSDTIGDFIVEFGDISLIYSSQNSTS